VDITIIGTGNMARGIATRALAGGHDVTLLGTTADKAEELAGELGGRVAAGTVGDPATGDVVVLAVPYEAAADVARSYDGSIIVDITNPVDFSGFEPIVPQAGSSAEEIAAAAPGAKVVKAFNTTFAGTLVDGAVAGQPLDVLIAGDDDGAKATVMAIATDGGLRPIDVGPLRRARQLEAAGYLHMAVTQTLSTPFATAVKVIG
jgi:8-hydroxy-5-deazaflavin:NADPH oxidoreductase